MTAPPAVVVDTNVFVAAGFRRGGAAAQLLAGIRRGAVRLVWDDATRDETRRIVRRIPPLAGWWDALAPLFRPEDRHAGAIDPAAFAMVADPDDRKFAALAAAAGATLVTLDAHLHAARAAGLVALASPRALVRRLADPPLAGAAVTSAAGTAP
jgi:predicted nucleic acid-binding protein